MMKVIKHGKNYIRYGKCDCGCEFEYDRKDTKAYKTIFADGFHSIIQKIDTCKVKKDNIDFYVTCPECGNRVLVDREI